MKITNVIPWFQPNYYYGDVENSCSTDYFHKCSNYVNNGIPNYNHGFHLPHLDSAYSGFSIYGGNYREYLEVKTLDTVKMNRNYCISMYVMLSRISKYSTNGLSVAFTLDSLLYNNASPYPPINITPQVDYDSNYIQDTLNWMKLEGNFEANGDYNFITIGNFRNDASTGSSLTGFGNFSGAYIFVDDVSLHEIKNSNAGNDTLINNPGIVQLGSNTDTSAFYEWWPHTGIADTNAMNPTANVTQTTTYYARKTQCGVVSVDTVLITVSPIGLKEIDYKDEFVLSPNPNNGSFALQSKSGKAFSGFVQLYDVCGKLVFEERIENQNRFTIHNEEISPGVYFVKLADKNKRVVFVSKTIVQ